MSHPFGNDRYPYGSAALATHDMVAAAGGYDFDEDTLYTGLFKGRPLGYSGAAGVLLIAGARSGKLTKWLAQNICSGSSFAHKLFLDPKGEGAYISRLGALDDRYQYYWNPSSYPGLPCHRINPTEHLNVNSPTVFEDAQEFASTWIERSGAVQGIYFEGRARTILHKVSLGLIERDGVLSLPTLYDALNSFITSEDDWNRNVGFYMSESRWPEIREYRKDLSKLRHSEAGGFDGVCGELDNSISALRSRQLRESLSPPFDISLSALSEDAHPQSVYLTPRPEFLSVWAPVIKSIFLGSRLARSRRPGAKRRLLWVIDEAAQLGRMKFVLDAYSIGAGMGITPITVWQSTHQMRALWEEAESTLTSSAGLQVYFGIRDYRAAEALSKRIGVETLDYVDERERDQARHRFRGAMSNLLDGGDFLKETLNAAHYRQAAETPRKLHRRLRTPDEIERMPDDKMYVVMDGVRGVIYADAIPYYDLPWMAGRYLDTPYYPPRGRVRIMTPRGPVFRRIITEPVPAGFAHFPQYADTGTWSYVEGFKPCL